MQVSAGDRVYAQGYGEVTITENVAQFDTIVEIRLSNGETAWTDSSLLSPA